MPATANIFVTLHYWGSKSPGAHDTADGGLAYLLYHDDPKRLSWQLTIDVGDILSFAWPFDSSAIGPHATLLGYAVPPALPLDRAERLANALPAENTNPPPCFVTLRGRSKELYFRILRKLRSGDKDETNFAAPDPAKIKRGKLTGPEKEMYRKMFDGLSTGSRALYTQFLYENLPAEVEAELTVESGKHRLNLKVFIKVRDGGSAEPADGPDDRVARLVATDWTDAEQLGAHSNGRRITKEIRPEHVDAVPTWRRNIAQYFLNYTNLKRGHKTLAAIKKRGIAKAASGADLKAVVEFVRNEIDARLITANAWAQPRENSGDERYQHLLQRRVGHVTKHRPSAAPLELFRHMRKIIRDQLGGTYGDEDNAAWVLQAGLAHCAEHAFLAFLVLVAIHDSSSKPAGMTCVYACAQARVDHAMVLIGLRAPLAEWLLIPPGNVHGRAGMTKGMFFDLKKTIALRHPATGTVCDPYLEKRYPEAADLLNAIKKNGTTKLLLHRVHPESMVPEVILQLGVPPESI